MKSTKMLRSKIEISFEKLVLLALKDQYEKMKNQKQLIEGSKFEFLKQKKKKLNTNFTIID